MAKKATYEGPWDSHEFAAGEVHDEAQSYPRGVPVKVSNELATRLEEGAERFTIEDYDEEADGKAAFNEPLPGFAGEEDSTEVMTDATITAEAGPVARQTGDAVTTPSTTTGGTATSGSTAGGTGVSGSTGAGTTRGSKGSRGRSSS